MKTIYVDNLLAQTMSSASPQMAQTALGRAKTNLEAIAAECIAHVDDLLRQFHMHPSSDPDERLGQMRENYQLARRMIGVAHAAGLTALDMAAKSLCKTVDSLLAANDCNWEPVRLHLQTMQLLRHPDRVGDQQGTLIAALGDLRKRFEAAPEAESKPPPIA